MRRERLEAAGQQRLELETISLPSRAVIRTGAERARKCGDQVAPPLRRLAAFAVDASIVVSSMATFLGLFRWLGGRLELNPVSTAAFAAAAVCVVSFYRLLWLLGGGETPGMAAMGLRLLNFDGRRPTRWRRVVRLGGTLLGMAAGGLGPLWTLGDEEQLGWNDHLSKTFPSPLSHEE